MTPLVGQFQKMEGVFYKKKRRCSFGVGLNTKICLIKTVDKVSGFGCSKAAKLNPELASTFVSYFTLFAESFSCLFLF